MVTPNTVARTTDLEPGDVITGVLADPVLSIEELAQAIGKVPAGAKAFLNTSKMAILETPWRL